MSAAKALPMLAAGLLLAACQPRGAVDASAPPATSAPAATTAAGTAPASAFRCGDLLLGVSRAAAGDTAIVSWSGHRRTLQKAAAEAGEHYADDMAAFHQVGDDATFTLAGADALSCSATDETSPWDEARARGVSLRAIGTEPGWLAEITPGDPPALKALLDYGERHVDVPALSKDEALPGYAGTTADGTAVSLRFVEGACSDGMSDQSYPAEVQLTVGAETFRGCGAQLYP